METYVGLDVHSKSSVFVIQDVDGKLVGRGEVPTSRQGFERACSQYRLPPGTKVALETGTVAFFAARELSRFHLDAVVSPCAPGPPGPSAGGPPHARRAPAAASS